MTLLKGLDDRRARWEKAARPWQRAGIILGVAAYLLFAHGCHSDKDCELSSGGGTISCEVGPPVNLRQEEAP